MAISTYQTYLMMKKSGDTYEVLVPIKDFSDLGGTPESLDVTTLSDDRHFYIPGIQDSEAITFTANFTKEDFAKLKALEGASHSFAVYFGTNGEHGKCLFDGELSAFIPGKGVNEVVDMTISIMPTSWEDDFD